MRTTTRTSDGARGGQTARRLLTVCLLLLGLVLAACSGPQGSRTAGGGGPAPRGPGGGEAPQRPPSGTIVVRTPVPMAGELAFDGEVSCGALVWQAESLPDGVTFEVELSVPATWRVSDRACPGGDGQRCETGVLDGATPSCIAVLEPVDPQDVDRTAVLKVSGLLHCDDREVCDATAAVLEEAATLDVVELVGRDESAPGPEGEEGPPTDPSTDPAVDGEEPAVDGEQPAGGAEEPEAEEPGTAP